MKLETRQLVRVILLAPIAGTISGLGFVAGTKLGLIPNWGFTNLVALLCGVSVALTGWIHALSLYIAGRFSSKRWITELVSMGLVVGSAFVIEVVGIRGLILTPLFVSAILASWFAAYGLFVTLTFVIGRDARKPPGQWRSRRG